MRCCCYREVSCLCIPVCLRFRRYQIFYKFPCSCFLCSVLIVKHPEKSTTDGYTTFVYKVICNLCDSLNCSRCRCICTVLIRAYCDCIITVAFYISCSVCFYDGDCFAVCICDSSCVWQGCDGAVAVEPTDVAVIITPMIISRCLYFIVIPLCSFYFEFSLFLLLMALPYLINVFDL